MAPLAAARMMAVCWLAIRDCWRSYSSRSAASAASVDWRRREMAPSPAPGIRVHVNQLNTVHPRTACAIKQRGSLLTAVCRKQQEPELNPKHHIEFMLLLVCNITGGTLTQRPGDSLEPGHELAKHDMKVGAPAAVSDPLSIACRDRLEPKPPPRAPCRLRGTSGEVGEPPLAVRCARCLSSECCSAASCMVGKVCSVHALGAHLLSLLLGRLLHRGEEMLRVHDPR